MCEEFQRKLTQSNPIAGVLDGRAPLVVESLMPTNDVTSFDGVESDFCSLLPELLSLLA